MNNRHTSREDWATAFVRDQLDPIIESMGISPKRVRIGFGQTQGGKNVIGECWDESVVADRVNEITIKVGMSGDPARVLDVVAHEYAHAVAPRMTGHKGEFVKIAKAFGLVGKMTATIASPEFELAAAIALQSDPGACGPMPGAAWADGGRPTSPKGPGTGAPGVPAGPMDRPPKQAPRNLLAECDNAAEHPEELPVVKFRASNAVMNHVKFCPVCGKETANRA